jgi:hypothetical protein
VYSVEGRESWREEGFKVPPLAYLEYAETRFEMYREIKRLWLEANGSPAADDQFPEPPKWQMFDQEKQWTDWTERLRPMHEKIRQIKLQSTERQAAAWARYEAAAAKA